MTSFSPGSLVRCREREWIVMPSDSPDLLRLRPLGGAEHEITGISLPLSRLLHIDAVEAATFAPPNSDLAGDYTSGRLLRDATRLTFRSGAGPFRSLGRINVRPRPFQIVPLLMALRLDPVRLLIADDVGIGKTIEAGLIVRELLDRGDAQRFMVLCPPHLCEQWQRELTEKFALDVVVVRSGTIAQLERALPPGDKSVFEHYPNLIVSIDFAKSDHWRASVIQGCPDLVIVDEAHTAARSTGDKATQQRYKLLCDLAKDPQRRLLLLTATPHSGIEDAFLSLLGLLDPGFEKLDLGHLTDEGRRRLARHFVQRRRADVQKWMGTDTPFPVRESREQHYELKQSAEYRKLFDDVYAFARRLVHTTDGTQSRVRQRVRYWTALALLRCIMSSPAAAEATLKARLDRLGPAEIEDPVEQRDVLAPYVLDNTDGEIAQDFEPTPVVEEGSQTLNPNEQQQLKNFVKRAAGLAGPQDPKGAVAAVEVAALLKGGFHPIVYCRYIATAEYLAAELKRRLKVTYPHLHVIAVTGLQADEEREKRVAELGESKQRVLVATDCLSEGINLQQAFDAVIHYDLPWNPNRLEQREGRVDRYGQPSPIVRTVLLYGSDNLIDEIVLKVLLRKAIEIHKTLGVTIPLPVDTDSVVQTMIQTLFQEGRQRGLLADQLGLFEEPPADLDALDATWERAAERDRVSRTRFAQHAIKPEEVAQELYESDLVLGDAATVASFVRNSCERLGVPLLPVVSPSTPTPPIYRLAPAALPQPIRDRVAPVWTSSRTHTAPAEVLLGFDLPLPDDVHLIGRMHPLTEALAEYLLDQALEPDSDLPPAARCSVIRTAAVTRRTTLLLLRLRLLIETAGQPAPVLAEELIVAGFAGSPGDLTWLSEEAARQLLDTAQPTGNIGIDRRHELLTEAIGWLPEITDDLTAIARARGVATLDAHRRVRQAVSLGRVAVRPQLPLDVLGVYLLLPVPQGIVSS